jgi:hypothetical protein
VVTSHGLRDQLLGLVGDDVTYRPQGPGRSRCASSLRRWSCSSPSLLSVVPRDSRLKIRFKRFWILWICS